MDNIDPKPKRKNDDKPKRHPRRRTLFAGFILSLMLFPVAVFMLESRFTPMPIVPTADLVYVEMEGEEFEIYVLDFQTGERTRLYNNPGVGLPQAKRYSPTDPFVMNVEWLEEEGVSLLFLEGLTINQTNRTIGKYPVFYSPINTLTWSPDGQWVTFSAHPYDPRVDTDKEAHAAEIWMVHVPTGELKRMTNNTYPDRYPAFSPDGTQIAYMSSPDGVPRLYVMDVATGESRRLGPDPYGDKSGESLGGEAYLKTLYKSADHPNWSPDGQWLVYQVLRRSAHDAAEDSFYINLYLIHANGTHNQVVTNSEKISVVHVWKQ